MLKVKKLRPDAILPQCAHSSEDLGYDLFAVEPATLTPHTATKVKTGVALAFQPWNDSANYGLLIRDRSSMASKDIMVTGGVIDAGYRGEVIVLLTLANPDRSVRIERGDKIAQVIPMKVLTSDVEEVEELPPARRGDAGFGSTGA